MSDLALRTANRVSVVTGVDQVQTPPVVAGEAIVAGAPVYIHATTGRAMNADASAASTADVQGVALHTVAIREPVTIVKQGALDGYDLSGMNYGAPVFLSNTTGILATSAGTVSVRVGTVYPALANSIANVYDKVLYVERSITPS